MVFTNEDFIFPYFFVLGSIPHRSTVSFKNNRIERDRHQHFWGAELENKESFILKHCFGIDLKTNKTSEKDLKSEIPSSKGEIRRKTVQNRPKPDPIQQCGVPGGSRDGQVATRHFCLMLDRHQQRMHLSVLNKWLEQFGGC